MSIPIDPSVMKFISPQERFQRMKQHQEALSNIIKDSPTATGLLAPRTVVQYQDIERRYEEFIKSYNESVQEPVDAWTKAGYNYQMIYDYISFRSMFGVGKVERVIQLGTMIREVTSLNVVASRKDKELQISTEGTEGLDSLRNYMYQLSQIGQLGRKGRDQVIFGLPEALVITNHILRLDQPNFHNYLTFHLQASVLILITCFTGARPGSLLADSRVKDSEYLQWKHVQLWREGQDERGYQLIVQLTLPHLKGRSRYYSEAKRISKRTLRSFVESDQKYEVNLDPTILIVALAFRRQAADYTSFDEWWSGNQALLKIKHEKKEDPVFINHQYDGTPAGPWTTDAANHTVSRMIRSSGLNYKASLYSFRRNFATQINDNLSAHTASSLMGHNPYSTTLKKCYAGDFDQLDLTNLMQTGDTTFAPTMSALLKPHVFRIQDIKKYNLTPDEIDQHVLSDENLIDMKKKRDDYTRERKEKYGKKKKDCWDQEELNVLQAHNNTIKARSRYLTLKALKAKHEKIFNELQDHVQVDENGVAILNEERLLEKYGVTDMRSQEELLQEEEALSLEVDEITVANAIGSSQEILHNNSNHNNNGDDIDTKDIDYGQDTDDEESVEPTEQEDADEEELANEENLMCDHAVDQNIVPPDTVDVTVKGIEGNVFNPLKQARYEDIKKFLEGQDRSYSAQSCIWCEEQGLPSSTVYPTLKQLASHLYTSQASTTWTFPSSPHRIGMHTNTAVFLREFAPQSTGSSFQCGYSNCSYTKVTQQTVQKHLREHLENDNIVDVPENEAINNLIEYIERHIGYTMTEEEINEIILQRQEKAKSNRKRRQDEKAKEGQKSKKKRTSQ